nr:retrovirus-related Pol polyprotein from transposon TNT 1-94 [Tanacetum cinerariifolium]
MLESDVLDDSTCLMLLEDVRGNALNLSDQGMQHDPGVPNGQATQAIIPNNAAFQTEDLDTYDSNCDDISNAKAFLMANISNYGSDFILEVPHIETYLNDMENQSVHAMQDFEQTPVLDVTDNEITEASKELSKVSLVNESLKMIKLHLANFDKVELLVYVRDTCPDAIKLSAKKVAATPKNNVKKVRFAEPLTSSSNIKQNDRISQTPSRNMKNKVEAQPRKVNNKNRVVEPIRDVDVKQSQLNANYELICATWNRSQLMNFVSKFLGSIRFEKDQIARIIRYGDYQLGNVTILEVYYVEGLGHNLFSVEAARTMLIFSKALIFLWAEAINTACYTQKRSLICLQYNKTPYELMQDKKSDLSFFHVSGSLSYPTNDNDDLGPRLHSLTPATSSSGLVSNPVSQQHCIPPNRDAWDRLFEPMFDEYFNPPIIVVSIVPVAATQRAVDLDDSHVPTSIDQDASSKKPKNFKQPMTDPSWIDAIQEEIYEFERLQVSELVPCPEKFMLIKQKWIYKVKTNEFSGVTPYYLPKVQEYVLVKPHHVIAPGLSSNSSKESYGLNGMVHNYYLEEAKKKTQYKNRNLKPRKMLSTRTHHTPNACTPKPRSNNQMSRNWLTSKSSEETLKVVPKADHSKNPSSFSNSKHFVCSTS